jgi:hypothetical protein
MVKAGKGKGKGERRRGRGSHNFFPLFSYVLFALLFFKGLTASFPLFKMFNSIKN